MLDLGCAPLQCHTKQGDSDAQATKTSGKAPRITLLLSTCFGGHALCLVAGAGRGALGFAAGIRGRALCLVAGLCCSVLC